MNSTLASPIIILTTHKTQLPPQKFAAVVGTLRLVGDGVYSYDSSSMVSIGAAFPGVNDVVKPNSYMIIPNSVIKDLSSLPFETFPPNIPGHQTDYPSIYVNDFASHAEFRNPGAHAEYKNIEGMTVNINGQDMIIGNLAYVVWSWEYFGMTALLYRVCKA